MPSLLSRLLLPRALSLLLATTLLCGSIRAAELSLAERTALLEQLRQVHAKEPTLEASFTQQRTAHLLNKPVNSEGTVYFSVPDKFRQEVKSPSPSLTVSDGSKMWIYYPSFNQVEIYTLGQRTMLDEALAALNDGLNFEHIDERFNFRAYHDAEGYRLDLVPKKPALRRMVAELTLYLNNEFLPTHTEMTLPKGDHLSTAYHNARRPPLAPSLFEFTPPADAHVVHPMGK